VLHFRDLRHEHRLLYVDRIARADLRLVTVLVHKPSLLEPEKFQERYRLYFYTTRYLLERVSWYCRDHRTKADAGDGTAEIIFSNRSGMAYSELRSYLGYLRNNSGHFEVTIDWSVVSEALVTSYPPGKRMGLQIADAVAGSFFYGVEQSQWGFNEPRYASMLAPAVYGRKGIHMGYGVKIWPREAMQLLTDEDYAWLRSVYQ
jgi:hypothetical protein